MSNTEIAPPPGTRDIGLSQGPDPLLAVLRITGPDAAALLQGQLCNDVLALQPGRAQFSAMNSPKGRMLTTLILWREGDDFRALVPGSLAETLLKRLRLYVLRSKVLLERETVRCAGLFETDAPALAARLGGALPTAALDWVALGGLSVLRPPGHARLLLVGPQKALEEPFRRALQAPAAAAAADADAWTRADVLAGVPWLALATQDEFVPQMANLDQLGGVSFNKGCYTGQEIVARLHYLGQLKRRMFLCRGPGTPPLPGTPVQTADGGSDAPPVGMVLQAAHEGAGFVASAVLQLSAAHSALRVADGPAFSALPEAYVYPGA